MITYNYFYGTARTQDHVYVYRFIVVVVVVFTLKAVPVSTQYEVLSNIRTGPTDADAFRGHRLTTQKGYTYQKEIKGPRKVSTHAIIGK